MKVEERKEVWKLELRSLELNECISVEVCGVKN